MSGLSDLLDVSKALIGMVHLLALPGSPRWRGSMEEVVERALEDARALAAGGMDALLVENHGDVPFSQSDAAATLRYRQLLSADVKIFADVQAKHGAPLAPVEIEQEARDSVARGLADALVVSGKATGEATPLEDVKRVRSAIRETPLLVGSGVTPDTVAELLSVLTAPSWELF